MVLFSVLFVFDLFCGTIVQSQTNKLFVYYPTWAVHTMPPSDLKFPSGIQTIYMHFSGHMVSTTPFFGPAVPGSIDSSDLAQKQRAFIDTCHRAGQKVLLSLTAQGGDGTILRNVANSATDRKAFVHAASAYMKRKGYDGIDLDWESDVDSGAVTRMIRELRDTLNTWSPPGIVTMATHSDPFIYPGIWGFYNTATMNLYLDAYFGMNYVMNTNERSWGSLGNANGVWRCMFDCPYARPTSAPWNGYTGGYWSQDFKTNSLVPWIANGAAREKVGIGLWNGGTTMLNSNASMVPGSPLVYGTPGYTTYAQVLTGTSNYVPEADHYWGIVGGLYSSWIDSAGAYKRTKWAKDTMQTNVFMLYDAYSGFLPTGQRYGRQPHFDAMVNAINAPQIPLPTGTFTVTPNTLPVGGGSVTLTWTSNGATSANIDQGVGGVALSGNRVVPVSMTTTYTLTLSSSAGTRYYAVTVTVANPPPSPPVLTTPANGATGVAASPTLAWSVAPGATSYRVQVSTSSGFGSIVADQSNISTTSYTASGLATNTTFYWHVSATNTSGTGAYSTTRNFTTAAPPSIPAFIYPASNAVGVPSSFVMRWRRSTLATLYHLQVAHDSLSTSRVINDSTLADTLSQVNNLASGTRFWRRVRAKGTGGWSGFSAASSFTTASVLPTGTFSVSPDSLPVGGGIVTLSWTSSGAQTANIDQGIGIVPLSGSRSVTAGASTRFVLTLTNASGSRQLFTDVWVALPGGQGAVDITSQGTPTVLIANPSGNGNPNIEVIRDGVTPPVGSGNVLEQYDTFTGGAARSFDWIGFQFATPRAFAGIIYQEGLDNQWGGCFVTLRVQVRSGGVWTDVQNLVSTPPYAGNNFVNYEMYALSFTQVSGDAIRIAGTPTGSAYYIGVGELRVFESQSGPPPSAPQLTFPANAATNQPVSVTLRWRAISGATSCHVQGSTDSLFTTMIVNDSTVTDSTRQLSSLQFLTKYYWRVRAKNAGGYGPFSAKWNFTTTDSLPLVPILLSPRNGGVNLGTSPLLCWKQSMRATRYHLQISRDSTFSTMVYSDSTIVDSICQVSSLSPLTKYYWRARAMNTGGSTSFSSKWTFTTKKRRRDITPTATIVSLILQPTGHGNHNPETIRDGIRPPRGHGNPNTQFDTYTGSIRQFDWLGYSFNTPHQFSNVEFQEGVETDSGGWFAGLGVQVRVNGTWIDVQNLTTVPQYDPNNGIDFESYELNFDPITADGIRIAGIPGGLFTYVSVAELRAMDDDTLTNDQKEAGLVPNDYVLFQNYPNPFNPSTKIRYAIPRSSFVMLAVYNALGQQVAQLVNEQQQAGYHDVVFRDQGLASGVYFCRMKAGDFVASKKLMLLK